MEKLRILVADDDVICRNNLVQAVNETGMGIAEHTVSSGAVVLEWLRQGGMDVVLLDIFMHGQDSISILKAIKNKFPNVDVIITSEKDSDSAAATLKALEYGAIDFLLKPQGSEHGNELNRTVNQLQLLFAQIKIKRFSVPTENTRESYIAGNDCPNTCQDEAETERSTALGRENRHNWDIVLIASSTGGPAALEKILGQLPSDFNIPILIVQHMPPEFTKVLAQTLKKKYSLNVVEGKRGDVIGSGQVIIAPGGMHMTVNRSDNTHYVIHTENTPPVNGVRPSADVLFGSVSGAYRDGNVLAVILTGMGNDGVHGVRELKRTCNCYCITQSEDTCVVYGMPKCVCENGLSDEAVGIENIAGRIRQIISNRR